MIEPSGGQEERRRSVRFSPKGTVVLLAGELAERGRVANLSRGGLQMTISAALAADLVGQAAQLELRLDGPGAEWMRLSGTIRRVERETVAIELTSVPPEFLELVEHTSTASYRNKQVISVILVDSMATRRAAMSEAFRTVGCTVVEMSTPLEAIVRLGEIQFEPTLIVIADSAPTSTSDDLRRFVDREHPAATLITVGDGLIEPEGLLHWLSSANPEDDLVARIRELLSRPA
jgi:hypothetical protein